jgi:hypothetical protein
MPIRAIRNPNDYLRDRGIRYLTSEACTLGLRSLYDVDEEVAVGVEDFFGMNLRCPARNYGKNSVLISKNVLWDLCVFLAFIEGADEVWDYVDEFGEGRHLRIHTNLTKTEEDREWKMIENGRCVRHSPVTGQKHRNFSSVHATWGYSN